MPINLVFSNKHIIVVEKPGGLLSVPGRGPDRQDCVVSWIKKNFPECIDQPAVHRLDMDTSGLMVLAITQEAHRHISIQFQDRIVHKKYITVVDGVLPQIQGKIELAFRLDVERRPHQIYDPIQGKVGITYWKTIAVGATTTRLEMTPITGRTHQLRLHAAHKLGLGCPIVGDKLYGTGKDSDKLMLHASFLSFLDPENNARIEFTSSPPF